MPKKVDAHQLTNDTVAGVAAGIVVSLFIGLYQVVDSYRERRDQVRYASELVWAGVDRIRGTDKPETRLLYYNRLLRDLENYLTSDRSDRLEFAEKHTLRLAFPYGLDGSVRFLTQVPARADKFFDIIVEQFEKTTEALAWPRPKCTEGRSP